MTPGYLLVAKQYRAYGLSRCGPRKSALHDCSGHRAPPGVRTGSAWSRARFARSIPQTLSAATSRVRTCIRWTRTPMHSRLSLCKWNLGVAASYRSLPDGNAALGCGHERLLLPHRQNQASDPTGDWTRGSPLLYATAINPSSERPSPPVTLEAQELGTPGA